MYARSKKLWLLVAVLVISAMLLTVCGPKPTPQTVVVEKTVIVEKPVKVEVEKVVTKEVEVQKVVTVEVEVEKEVFVTKEVPVTVEVEKVVTETIMIEVTPTTEPSPTPKLAEQEVQVETPSNLIASWVISQSYTFPVEGTRDKYESVTYTYDVVLITDTLVFPTDVITVTAERDYGFLTVTRQGSTEPVLEVVLDDQAMAHLIWSWDHDEFAEPSLGTLSQFHWVYRNESPVETGNNLSFSKGWGWYINEGNILFSTFNSDIPKVGAVWRAVVLGPEMANYGNALEREGIDAWDRWFNHRGVQEEPLGVYTHFK
jgi:hypothetical protein